MKPKSSGVAARTIAPALNESVRRFVSQFFAEANEAGIEYVVLRNYEGLPEQVGNDIDLFVKPQDVTTFANLLCRVATRCGWQLVMAPQKHGFLSYTFVSVNRAANLKRLKWDAWYPIHWKGIEWIDADVLLQTRRLHKGGFYVPAPGVEAATLLLKEVLQYGRIRKKYLESIPDMVQRDSPSFRATLGTPFGSGVVELFLKRVQAKDWKSIERSYHSLRTRLVIRSLVHCPISTVSGVARFVVGHLLWYMKNPTGIVICLIGPGGSGKSTMAALLADSLAEVFDRTAYYHGHFGILPELKSFLRVTKLTQQHADPSNTPRNPPGRLRSLVYLIYYGVDYLLGHFPIAYARANGHLVVLDRYFYDYAIQTGPIQPSSKLFRLLVRLIPEPDVIYYLHAPAELVRIRKPEIGIEEIKHQQQVCIDLSSTLPNSVLIDNSRSPKDVVNDMREHVLIAMTTRVSECGNW